MIKPLRSPWDREFSNVWIHASETDVKQHSSYAAAKAGDVNAAIHLVYDTMNDDVLVRLIEFGEEKAPILVSVHASWSRAALSSAQRF